MDGKIDGSNMFLGRHYYWFACPLCIGALFRVLAGSTVTGFLDSGVIEAHKCNAFCGSTDDPISAVGDDRCNAARVFLFSGVLAVGIFLVLLCSRVIRDGIPQPGSTVPLRAGTAVHVLCLFSSIKTLLF